MTDPRSLNATASRCRAAKSSSLSKGGTNFGATDEFGYKGVDGVATAWDFHATLLHPLGLNHERLSFYHNGIERRLTDVPGHVFKGLLA